MRIGKIADRMAVGGDFLHEFRTPPDETPNQKKCGADMVFFEDSQQSRGKRGVGPVIECERDRIRVAGTTDRGSEQLRARRNRSPSKRARSGSQQRAEVANKGCSRFGG